MTDDTLAPDRRLAPRVVVLWRSATAITVATVVVVMLPVAAVVGGVAWALPLVALLVGIGVLVWLPSARYEAWRWRLTDRALELEYGLWRRQVRALPYFRIQHIDLEHGPLDRWLGLAQLQVHTASVTAILPGLDAGEAPDIRARLLDLTAASVAEAPEGDVDAV